MSLSKLIFYGVIQMRPKLMFNPIGKTEAERERELLKTTESVAKQEKHSLIACDAYHIMFSLRLKGQM